MPYIRAKDRRPSQIVPLRDFEYENQRRTIKENVIVIYIFMRLKVIRECTNTNSNPTLVHVFPVNSAETVRQQSDCLAQYLFLKTAGHVANAKIKIRIILRMLSNHQRSI